LLGIVPTVWFGIDLTPAAMMSLIGAVFPVVTPYLEFVNMYLTSFFSSLQTATALGFDSYIITVAFAYIGGVLSQQNRRELELLAKLSRGNTTTVVLEGNTFQTAPSRGRGLERGFSDLAAVMGANEDVEPTTMRSARRAIYEDENADAYSPDERRALREHAMSMAAQQREVERKMRRAADESRVPRPRTAGDDVDWEFI